MILYNKSTLIPSFKVLKSLPVQLIICLGLAFLIGDHLPVTWVSYAYSISVLIKDYLMVLLPFVVFSYMASALIAFEQRAPFLILIILSLVTLSNGIAVLISYGTGKLFLPLITLTHPENVFSTKEVIEPLISFSLPMSADKALFVGLVIGIIGSFWPHPSLKKAIYSLRDYMTILLQKTFIPFLPLYVFGFVLKLEYEDSLDILIHNYGQVFLLTLCLLFSYIFIIYVLGSRLNFSKVKETLRNMIPAGLTGFSTMSSAATMPVTLEATEQNLKDREFADLIIPTTANIHLLGDALSIPIAVLFVMLLSGQSLPDFSTYLVFTFYYCLTKFSAAGIPGGGVLVLLPVFQKYLGLSPEMASFVATLYILQDPIFTAFNVMGNGGFAILIHQLLGKRLKHT